MDNTNIYLAPPLISDHASPGKGRLTTWEPPLHHRAVIGKRGEGAVAPAASSPNCAWPGPGIPTRKPVGGLCVRHSCDVSVIWWHEIFVRKLIALDVGGGGLEDRRLWIVRRILPPGQSPLPTTATVNCSPVYTNRIACAKIRDGEIRVVFLLRARDAWLIFGLQYRLEIIRNRRRRSRIQWLASTCPVRRCARREKK